jgi:hypothetical protein
MSTQRKSDGIGGLGGLPISRREAMRRGLLGAAGLLLADRLALGAPAAKPTAPAREIGRAHV